MARCPQVRRARAGDGVDALAQVELEVRELIGRSGVDPVREGRAVRTLVEDVVADYDERSLSGGLPSLLDAGQAVQQVWDAVAGFGALQPYLDDPLIEEMWINERLTGGCAVVAATLARTLGRARSGQHDVSVDRPRQTRHPV